MTGREQPNPPAGSWSEAAALTTGARLVWGSAPRRVPAYPDAIYAKGREAEIRASSARSRPWLPPRAPRAVARTDGGVQRARPAAVGTDADHQAAATGSARRRVTGWPVPSRSAVATSQGLTVVIPSGVSERSVSLGVGTARARDVTASRRKPREDARPGRVGARSHRGAGSGHAQDAGRASRSATTVPGASLRLAHAGRTLGRACYAPHGSTWAQGGNRYVVTLGLILTAAGRKCSRSRPVGWGVWQAFDGVDRALKDRCL